MPGDRRATCLLLTPDGRAVQRRVGLRHGTAVAATMTSILDEQQLRQIRTLGTHIIDALNAAPVTRTTIGG